MYGLVYLLLFVGAVFIYWIVRTHQREAAEKAAKDLPLAVQRESRAKELGWRYDGTHSGNIRYRFSSQTASGHSWELRYDSDASSSVSQPKLVWEIAALRTERTVFEISHGKAFELMQGTYAMKAASVAASIAWAVGSRSAQDAIAFCQEAGTQDVGSSALRSRFKIMARSVSDVYALVDDEIENLLLNWPPTVEPAFDPYQQTTITRGPDGLRIECRYDSTDMPLFEHIVKLGCSLAIRIRPV